MTPRFLLSTVALATFASLAACGGGAASNGDVQAQQVGGIGGSGSAAQGIGGIGGSGSAAQGIGGIGGSGTNAQGVVDSGLTSVAAVRACGVRSVYVTIAGVRVNQNISAALDGEGWVELALPAPVRMDLMTLASGSPLPVDLTTLPAGTYRQVRLQVVDGGTVVTTAGVEAALAVPGAAQGGLPLDAAITVADGQVAVSTQDLDVCNAVTTSAGTYALVAVVRGTTPVASAF